MKNVNVVKFSNGVEVINLTPHKIRFEDGDKLIEVPTSIVLNAESNEIVKSIKDGVTFVTPSFRGDEKGYKLIHELKEEYPNALLVGSIIASQAYAGLVVAMVAVPGYERVAPAEKRMRIDKFTIY